VAVGLSASQEGLSAMDLVIRLRSRRVVPTVSVKFLFPTLLRYILTVATHAFSPLLHEMSESLSAMCNADVISGYCRPERYCCYFPPTWDSFRLWV